MSEINVNEVIENSLEEETPSQEVEETVEEETAPTADETPEEVEEEESEVEVEESDEEVDENGKKVPLEALTDERRKRQELEDQLKKIQEGIGELKQQGANQAPPKDIYEAFDRDPKGVTRDLNAEIQKLSSDDPYGNAAQIEQLRDLKIDLARREVQNINQTLQSQTKATKVLSEITRQIPDFNQKQNVLTEFAINELGYTQEDLVRLTNLNNEDAAVREVVRINKLYEKFNAKPQKKVVKKKPTEVEGAGKGIQKTDVTRSDLIKKAVESGGGTDAWAAYFEDIGLAED